MRGQSDYGGAFSATLEPSYILLALSPLDLHSEVQLIIK